MTSKELIQTSLKKNLKAYELFLVLIGLLECSMMIYGAITFDFSEWRRVAYFSSYIVLLSLTIITFITNKLFINKEKYQNVIFYNAVIYVTLLIFWSAFISSLDIIGQGYEVTYMTILAAMASIIAIHPLLFLSVTLISTLEIILVCILSQAPLHGPFYINHFIFIIVILAVQLKNYNTNKNQVILNQKLQILAEYDGLTSIKNRRSLDSFIADIVSSNKMFTIAMMDVDDFKKSTIPLVTRKVTILLNSSLKI